MRDVSTIIVRHFKTSLHLYLSIYLNFCLCLSMLGGFCYLKSQQKTLHWSHKMHSRWWIFVLLIFIGFNCMWCSCRKKNILSFSLSPFFFFFFVHQNKIQNWFLTKLIGVHRWEYTILIISFSVIFKFFVFCFYFNVSFVSYVMQLRNASHYKLNSSNKKQNKKMDFHLVFREIRNGMKYAFRKCQN